MLLRSSRKGWCVLRHLIHDLLLIPNRPTNSRGIAGTVMSTMFLEQCAFSRLASAWVRPVLSVVGMPFPYLKSEQGPIIGRWDFFLERNFPLRTLGGGHGKVSLRALARRVGADQLFM